MPGPPAAAAGGRKARSSARKACGGGARRVSWSGILRQSPSSLIDCQGQLVCLGTETVEQPRAVLPPYWSHANPIDVLPDAPPARFADSLEIVLRDDQVDAALVILTRRRSPPRQTPPGKWPALPAGSRSPCSFPTTGGGALSLASCLAIARSWELRELQGETERHNRGMLAIFTNAGFELDYGDGSEEVRARRPLTRRATS